MKEGWKRAGGADILVLLKLESKLESVLSEQISSLATTAQSKTQRPHNMAENMDIAVRFKSKGSMLGLGPRLELPQKRASLTLLLELCRSMISSLEIRIWIDIKTCEKTLRLLEAYNVFLPGDFCGTIFPPGTLHFPLDALNCSKTQRVRLMAELKWCTVALVALITSQHTSLNS